MATIKTSIQIQDNMSRAFQSMNTAMNVVLNSFESLQRASGNAVDTASIQLARQELARAGAAFDQIENEIRQANGEQQRFNNEIRAGTSAAGNLLNKVMAVVGAYLSLKGALDVIKLSDGMTNIEARLTLLVDSIPKVEDVNANLNLSVENSEVDEVAKLQQQIFDAAQRSYAPYADVADLVGKIGTNARDAFGSTDEVVAFAELLNKQYGIAGTNAEGVKNATLQLTQALGGGILRGQELNSIFEHAPNLIQMIADYLEVPKGKIREMAGDGQLSADVIKQAMFSAADGINEKFNSMPLTFEQLWTAFKNEALWAFQPVLQGINDIANSEKFKGFIDSAVNSLYTLSAVAMSTLDTMMSVSGFMYDNWSLIGPIIGTVTALLIGYTTALIAVKVAKMATAAWTVITTTATLLYTAATTSGTTATWAAVAAAWGLNTALAANPIFIVIMAMAVLIGVLYLAVAAINHFAGTSISATGIIAGTFMVLATFIRNRIVDMWNVFASFWEFFANVGKDPVYAVKRLFYNLASNVLDQAIAMSSGWDGFATNFVNAIIKAVNIAIGAWNKFIEILPDGVAGSLGLGKGTEYSYRESITGDLQNIKGALGDWVGDAPADYWEAPRMEARSLGDAWNTGYDWGANLLSNDPREGQGGNSFDDLMNGVQGALSPLTDDGKDTAKNTAKMAKSMEASEEDLKYMRDLAERDVINRFTTAEINIEMNNENNINNEMDIDGVIDRFGEKMEEAVHNVAEGGEVDV